MTDTPSSYAVSAILDRIDRMAAEIPGVISSEDTECLHRMRVASRRLRTALLLMGAEAGITDGRVFFKLVRAVTKSLGRARDLDVQIGWLGSFAETCVLRERPGVRRLILRLGQAREKLQPGIVDLLSSLSADRTLAEVMHQLQTTRLEIEMRGASPRGGDMAQATRVLGLQIESVIRHSSSLAVPDASEGQHRMRIEVKRFRYAIEIYRDLYAVVFDECGAPEGMNTLDGGLAIVKKLQSLLGDLHDADVWIARIPEFIEREKDFTERYFGTPRFFFRRIAPGYEAISADRFAFRAARYQYTAEFWRTTLRENSWGQLRSTLLAAYRSCV
ncbi:MAG: CHAD domain-containing protein [Synergistaceae bacterium]|jgi:CHAD domain-containing protein|nr:CHAD domain-containing protein [Synergistaceae bacterium]